MLFIGVGVVPEERDQGSQDPRSAEAALETMCFVESLLYWMECIAGQTLNRRYRGPVSLNGEHQARSDGLSVDQNRARPADPMLAADMSAREVQLVPQKVAEQQAWIYFALKLVAVDAQRNLGESSRLQSKLLTGRYRRPETGCKTRLGDCSGQLGIRLRQMALFLRNWPAFGHTWLYPNRRNAAMSARPHFQAFFFLALSLLVAGPAYAQDRPVRVSEQVRHRDRLATVDLPANTVAVEFTVAPAPRVRAVRAAPTRQGSGVEAPPPAPTSRDPIEPETMALVGNALGGGGFGGGASGDFQNPGPPVLDHIELTPRQPWFNERGNVHTVLAYSASTGSVPSWNFNKNFPGLMTVNLKVEEGATYLVDFSVSSWGSGTYRVETDSGDQEFADNGGDLEHVLVALNASESGWVSVRLKREGTGHYTYAIIVNRME